MHAETKDGMVEMCSYSAKLKNVWLILLCCFLLLGLVCIFKKLLTMLIKLMRAGLKPNIKLINSPRSTLHKHTLLLDTHELSN